MTQPAVTEEQKVPAQQPQSERVFHSSNQMEAVLEVFGEALGASGVTTENVRRLQAEIREKYGKDLPLGALAMI